MLDGLSLMSLFWNVDLEDQDSDADFQDVPAISEETERKYLTLSWWILHVGWKDVGERVRRAVEEVFEGLVPYDIYPALYSRIYTTQSISEDQTICV